MTTTMVSYRGLGPKGKAQVLAALYDYSTTYHQEKSKTFYYGPAVMTVDYAARILREKKNATTDKDWYQVPGSNPMHFNRIFERPVYVKFGTGKFDAKLFDRHNGGVGTAQAIVKKLLAEFKATK